MPIVKLLYLDSVDEEDGTKFWYWDDTHWVIERTDGKCLMYTGRRKGVSFMWDEEYRTLEECREILSK
mgnify:CR=1 FL=1